ncbi:hypothetical protein FACS1894186_4800 [Alphaproteobacteria bacterium]|nr:hypothetical protein FACS1894186_4800 [Alphaproteobacteria bacterium]
MTPEEYSEALDRGAGLVCLAVIAEALAQAKESVRQLAWLDMDDPKTIRLIATAKAAAETLDNLRLILVDCGAVREYLEAMKEAKNVER